MHGSLSGRDRRNTIGYPLAPGPEPDRSVPTPAAAQREKKRAAQMISENPGYSFHERRPEDNPHMAVVPVSQSACKAA